MAGKSKVMLSERNVIAEARAVEAGHRARVQPGGWVKVSSDTHGDLGKWYRVEFVAGADDGLVRFTCTPNGPKAYSDDHFYASTGLPGVVSCMHAALAARRLEREGLVRWDNAGRWTVTEKAISLSESVGSADRQPRAGASRGRVGASRGTAGATSGSPPAEAGTGKHTSSRTSSSMDPCHPVTNSTTPATVPTSNAEADQPVRTGRASTPTTLNPSSPSSTRGEDEATGPSRIARQGTSTTRPTPTSGTGSGIADDATPPTSADTECCDVSARQQMARALVRPEPRQPADPFEGLPS